MAPTKTSQRVPVQAFLLVVAVAVLATASTIAWAGPCGTTLPPAASAPAEGGGKFRLITELCPALAAPAIAASAAQLGLYEAPVRAISIEGAAAAASAVQAVAPTPPVPQAPPGPVERRILELAPALTEAARTHGVDPLLLHAVAHVESRHNVQAVSPAGARGALQLMPATAQRFGVTRPEQNLHDAKTNAGAGAALLRTLVDRYGHDLTLVLAAYNAGEGAVAKYGNTVPPYPETQAYVRDVLAVYRRLGQTFTVSRAGTLVARGDQP